MADNSTTLSRTQLLYGFCLSLAALIGFFLADPLQSSSLAVLAVIVGILCWPLFARWHHPLLVFSLHSAFIMAFLPGQLPLWAFFAAGGFVLVVFHRAINPQVRLIPPGGVPLALVVLGAVVLVTALVQGGIGFRALGSASTGSKKYIFILLAIMTYFVLVSRPVDRRWAFGYVALFLLSGLTGLLGHLVYNAGGNFFWLFSVIDPSPALGQAMSEWDVRGQTVFRSTGTVMAASAVIGLLIARFGMREMFNLKRPWILLLLLLSIAGGSIGGFRSFLLGSCIFLVVVFFLEGLHRTRYLPSAIGLGLGVFVFLISFSDKLPEGAQRAVSFLPVKVAPHVRQDAQGSIEWRVRMWELLWKEVPSHLLLGKGLAINPQELELSKFNASLGYGIQAEWAILAGEYHNGPMSVILPFGIWGVLAFGWFIAAATLRFRWLCQHSPPELIQINRALFAMFISKFIFFMLVFGSLYSELVEFTALIGLAESLNYGVRPATQEELPAIELESSLEAEHS